MKDLLLAREELLQLKVKYTLEEQEAKANAGVQRSLDAMKSNVEQKYNSMAKEAAVAQQMLKESEPKFNAMAKKAVEAMEKVKVYEKVNAELAKENAMLKAKVTESFY
jgi:hypothetical protein